MKKLFLVLAAALGSMTASAQWTSGAEAVAAGEFAFYNAATGQFINYGDTWGTRAWMRNTGVFLTLDETLNGFKIHSTVSNGGANNFMGDANCWMDNVGLEYTFENVATVEGEFVYAIKSTAGYVTAAKDNGCAHSAEISEESKWILVTKEMVVKASETATKDAPFDLTTIIECANFGRNSTNAKAWGDPAPSIAAKFTNNEFWNDNAEAFNMNFSFSQTLTGLKAGKYVLKVQGFYRAGAALEVTAESAQNAYIFANDNKTAIRLITSEETPAAGDADKANGLPNNQYQAFKCFDEGQYDNTLEFVLEEDGDITIGIAKEDLIDTDWTCFDNFRLFYLGAASDEESTPTAVGEVVNNSNDNNVIYDLSGRRVEKASKGIYIINGKKVIK